MGKAHRPPLAATTIVAVTAPAGAAQAAPNTVDLGLAKPPKGGAHGMAATIAVH